MPLVKIDGNYFDGAMVQKEANTKNYRDIIIAAEIKHGQRKEGVEQGPEALIQHCQGLNTIKNATDLIKVGSTTLASEPDQIIINDNPEVTIWRPKAVGEFTHQLYHQTYEKAWQQWQAQGHLPRILTLGGDHSLAIGSVTASARLSRNILRHPNQNTGQSSLAFKKPELLVVWVDAHADINTPSSTSSGNLHGCPVSLLLGLDLEGWSQLSHFDWTRKISWGPSFIEPHRILYIGARDIDALEQDILDELGIEVITMNRFKTNRRRVTEMLNSWLAKVDPHGEHPIHLSFDIDGIDPRFAPSTGTAVPDGLLLEEGLKIIDILSDTGRLLAMDLVEVNPALGSTEDVTLTLDTATSIIDRFIHHN